MSEEKQEQKQEEKQEKKQEEKQEEKRGEKQEEKSITLKRPREKNESSFPDDLEIPECALNDPKFLRSYVNILNDSRVYKRRRLNGDRTSSRFDVDCDYNITVVYNEPVIKRKSILANTQSPKQKNTDENSKRKSVSFLSKITYIDAVELDGGSSDWTDVEDESSEKSKVKTKSKKEAKLGSKLKMAATTNGQPSSKNHKKKTKEKSSNKSGHKSKSAPKELFKFKITKPFRKSGRSKGKKLKHLQKKFGKRMFKSFVRVKRSFNLTKIPEQVSVPLDKITLKTDAATSPQKSCPSIQEFLISKVTKKVKISLAPMPTNTGDTTETRTNGEETMQNNLIESNSCNNTQNSCSLENDVQSDNPKDRQETTEKAETNHNILVALSTECSNVLEGNNINGDIVPVEEIDSPDMTNVSCNDTEPSQELVESNPHPNVIDKITCSMYYNTNKDETAMMNGQMHESNKDDLADLVDISSSLNFSLSS